MSSEFPRRAVPPAPLSAAQNSIPPAPPLPPQRTPQPTTARSAFARFVTQPFTAYGSRPATAQTNRADTARSAALFAPKLLGVNPLSCQNTSLKTRGGAEITALDINRSRTHAIVAGRDILQTIRIDGTSCAVETNIRAAIIDHDRLNATRHRDTLDIHDVKWSHGDYSSYIATAATNGKVVVYDLGRPGTELARLHEHTRQVHRVAFSPFQGHLLLTGSQDGTVRLWDLRDVRSEAMVCRSRTRFMGQSDGVRDLKWSTNDAVEFAFGTDSGVVQKWDYRSNKGAKFKIHAHDKYCTSVDWHPDGKHLMSAGQDKTVKIWDFQSEVRKQRPQWVIRTPYPVLNALWRPPCWSDDERVGGGLQCTQVVTSYDRQYATVHLWDFRRAYIPFREMCNWSSAPTAMVWQSQRLLWSVNREGEFYQTDVQYAPKVIDRRPMQAFAVSPTGEICVFSQKRVRRRPSDLDYSQSSFTEDGVTLDEKNDLNRSMAIDDSLDDSFLSSTYKRHHTRTTSNRSSKSAASTPPSFPESEMHMVAKLNDTLTKQDRSVGPVQVAYRGVLDGTLNSLIFSYLAQKYKTVALPESPTVSSYLNIRKVFDQNALYARKTGAYRMEQTWRIFGSVITQEIMRRASENRKRRLLPSPDAKTTPESVNSKKPLEQSPVIPNPVLRVVQAASSHGASPLGLESSSNVATPLVRPHNSLGLQSPHAVPNLDHAEHMELPPSLVTRSHSDTQDSPSTVTAMTKAIVEMSPSPRTGPLPLSDELQWFTTPNEINERKAQMTNWRAMPKVPLDIEMPGGGLGAINIPPTLGRHNSDDSFAMLSTSSSSLREASSQPYSSARSRPPSMTQIPELFQAVAGDFIPPLDPTLRTNTEKSFSTLSTSSSKAGFSYFGTSSSLEYAIPGRLSELHSAEMNHLEASGTIVPDEAGTASTLREIEKEPFTFSDFTTVAEHLELKPITTDQLLAHVSRYYTDSIPDAQAVYHLIVLLKPLLGLTSQVQASSAQEHMSFPSAMHAESVLAAYQHQLQSLQIYNPLVSVSRTAHDFQTPEEPTSAVDIAPMAAHSQIGFVCQGCHKPINNPTTKMRCESCGKRQAPCPICWQKYPAIKGNTKLRKTSRKSSVVKPWSREQQSTKPPVAPPSLEESNSTAADTTAPQSNHPVLWLACLTCSHAAHFACMTHIQADPSIGGKCPTEGCVCDCIPGPYRMRLDREAAAARARRDVGSVRGDSRRVAESGAVRGLRGLSLDGGTGAVVDGLPVERDGGGRTLVERRVRVVEPGR